MNTEDKGRTSRKEETAPIPEGTQQVYNEAQDKDNSQEYQYSDELLPAAREFTGRVKDGSAMLVGWAFKDTEGMSGVKGMLIPGQGAQILVVIDTDLTMGQQTGAVLEMMQAHLQQPNSPGIVNFASRGPLTLDADSQVASGLISFLEEEMEARRAKKDAQKTGKRKGDHGQ